MCQHPANMFIEEDVYVDDIPSHPCCLYIALVLSSEAYAKIVEVNAKVALRSDGAIAYISPVDILVDGQNLGMKFLTDCELIFSNKIVGFVGKLVGIMVSIYLQLNIVDLLMNKLYI